MNIRVQFKDNICWSTQTIGYDKLNYCLDILRHSILYTSSDGTVVENWQKNQHEHRKFILSNYFIRQNGNNRENNHPYVIGIEKDGSFWLYRICYNKIKNHIYLVKDKKFEYDEKMGSKKQGWKVVELKDIRKYVDVVLYSVDLSPHVFEQNGNILEWYEWTEEKK